ncbi:MAG: hypothetical protein LQ345_005172 [Seirophora villosa]|nr:MAG: hypothetical protein LQ345_005172 [Seirophora villosa]
MENKASPRDTRPDDLVPYFLMRKNTTELLHGLLLPRFLQSVLFQAVEEKTEINEGQVDNLKYTPSRPAKGMRRLCRMLEDVKFSGDYAGAALSTMLEDKQRNRLAREVAGEGKSRVYNAVFKPSPTREHAADEHTRSESTLSNKAGYSLSGLQCDLQSCLASKDFGGWNEKSHNAASHKPINQFATALGFLLTSYTWSQEVQRIGTLINDHPPRGEDEVQALLIEILAQLHSSSKAEYQEVREINEENYDTRSAYNWYADADTIG